MPTPPQITSVVAGHFENPKGWGVIMCGGLACRGAKHRAHEPMSMCGGTGLSHALCNGGNACFLQDFARSFQLDMRHEAVGSRQSGI